MARPSGVKFPCYDYTFGEGGRTADHIEEAQLILDVDRESCKKIAQRSTTIPSADLDAFYNRHTIPTIVDAQKAKAWGMVQDIMILNPTGQSQPNVAVWTVGW